MGKQQWQVMYKSSENWAVLAFNGGDLQIGVEVSDQYSVSWWAQRLGRPLEMLESSLLEVSNVMYVPLSPIDHDSLMIGEWRLVRLVRMFNMLGVEVGDIHNTKCRENTIKCLVDKALMRRIV